MNKQAVLSLSGGMDSSTLLLHLLANEYDVTALSFDYGQKHRVELNKAKSLVEYLQSMGLNVNHHIITLGGMKELLNSSLTSDNKETPEGHYAEENMKETVVPNRNKIFSSLVQAAALSIATSKNTEVKICLGIHAGDHAIYPDCRPEFRDVDEKAFKIGNWDSHLVNYYTPYLDTDKAGILKDGLRACEVLGVDFDEVYKRTNTSYKPYSSGNSDYKSASSVERIEAFLSINRKDPITYEDDEGIADWDKVTAHVKEVLASHN